jgi:L-seryl-tRNA(Ser) seleniumtransferase
MANELLRMLPSVDLLLARPVAIKLAISFTHDRVRDLIREVTDQLRREILSGRWPDSPEKSQNSLLDGAMTAEIERRLEESAARLGRQSLKRVVNATGVIIHTNLGRAPLAQAAIDAIVAVTSGYSSLEYDLAAGARGHRESHCQDLLARLVGSESAIVANNNAAAVLLVLNTLAEGGEVIVLARRVDRDRRELSYSRRNAEERGEALRSWNYESHSNWRLRERNHREHAAHPARSPFELSHHRLHGAPFGQRNR